MNPSIIPLKGIAFRKKCDPRGMRTLDLQDENLTSWAARRWGQAQLGINRAKRGPIEAL